MRVFAHCPRTGEPRPTHAELTRAEFRRLTGALVYWCGACHTSHDAQRSDLWLEGEDPPPVAAAETPAWPAGKRASR